MKIIISILFVILPLSVLSQEDLYKWGKPTSKGIDNYIKNNDYQFIIDFRKFIKDSFYIEPFISTDDLSEYYNYNKYELGYFEYPDNIVITNEPRYIDYELSRLSEFRRSQYRETNQFVRAVIMHEICHCYFYQIMMTARQNNELEHEFSMGLKIILIDEFGAEFVEEGICEYVVQLMGEMIGYDEKVNITKYQLIHERSSYEVQYRYSSQFVKPIVDKLGITNAIYKIITNKPPSTEEILKPENYYQRLGI